MHRLIRWLLGAAGAGFIISLLCCDASFQAYGQDHVTFIQETALVPAQRLTVVEHRMTGGPLPINDCVAPEPKYGFAPSDARAFQWMRLSNFSAGAVMRWIFYRPDGAAYYSDFFPFSNSGAGCIGAYIDINGELPALVSGAWQVRVFYNNERVATDYFTISGPHLATSVSAASYQPPAGNFQTPAAAAAVMAVYGNSLATATVVATTQPLPTALAGVVVKVRDSDDVERVAPLFFVSPTQINYLVPLDTKDGVATVTITRSTGIIATGLLMVAKVAPALFTANATGQGLAAALALRIQADGTQIYEPIAFFDASQSRFIAQPIDLGPETDEVFLLLFGTGFRGRSALTAVTCRVGETEAQVTFAGAQAGFAGLDQANVLLPRALAGRGEVEVAFSVDNKAANVVRVQIK